MSDNSKETNPTVTIQVINVLKSQSYPMPTGAIREFLPSASSGAISGALHRLAQAGVVHKAQDSVGRNTWEAKADLVKYLSLCKKQITQAPNRKKKHTGPGPISTAIARIEKENRSLKRENQELKETLRKVKKYVRGIKI